MEGDLSISDVPQAVVNNVQRDKSQRLGSAALLHKWWGRRTPSIARVASYLALTNSQLSGNRNNLLAALSEPKPDDETIQLAIADIRSHRHHSVPCVLDLFAGSGTIAFEFTRLGCDTTALEIYPTAYHIIKAITSLSPELYHSLMGLLEQVIERVRAKKLEFPLDDRILYLNTLRCGACDQLSPIRRSMQINVDQELHIVSSSPWVVETRTVTPTLGRVQPLCMNCGISLEPGILVPIPAYNIDQNSLIRGGAIRNLSKKEHDELITLLSQERFSDLIATQGADEMRHLRRYDITSIANLFSERQLLTQLRLCVAADEALMKYESDTNTASASNPLRRLTAFMLSYCAEHSTKLSDWNFKTNSVMSVFERLSYSISPSFVETNSMDLCRRWLKKIKPVFESKDSLSCNVLLGDAKKIAVNSESFDVVAADPPHYDSVPYAQYATFSWAWESCLLTHTTPLYRDFTAIRSDKSGCEQDIETALSEAFRVLKYGGTLVMFVFGKSDLSDFNSYIHIAQEKCGFELVNLVRIPEQSSTFSSVEQSNFIAYFLKPALNEPTTNLGISVDNLIAKAEKGEPVLRHGLARFLIEKLNKDAIDSMIEIYLPHGKGSSDIEKVLEIVQERDLKSLIQQCFGFNLKSVARELKAQNPNLTDLSDLDVIASNFGFTLPSLADEPGPEQIKQKFKKSASTIKNSMDKDLIRGCFGESMTMFEDYLRRSMFHLVEGLYGEDYKTILLEILKKSNPNANVSRLSFGDISSLFKDLPDYIAGSNISDMVKEKFGSAHIYKTGKPERLAEKLKEVVAWRNKVVGHAGDFWNKTSTEQISEELSGVLNDCVKLVSDMVSSKAIPLIAVPVLEKRDIYNRFGYELKIDDGTVLHIGSGTSPTMELGTPYFYYASNTNPKPVEPFIFKIRN
jgi:hypothetical protein